MGNLHGCSIFTWTKCHEKLMKGCKGEESWRLIVSKESNFRSTTVERRYDANG